MELELAVALAEVLLPSRQGRSPGDAEEALSVIHGCVIHCLKTRRLDMDEHLPCPWSALQAPLTCVRHLGPQSLRAAVRVPAGLWSPWAPGRVRFPARSVVAVASALRGLWDRGPRFFAGLGHRLPSVLSHMGVSTGQLTAWLSSE